MYILIDEVLDEIGHVTDDIHRADSEDHLTAMDDEEIRAIDQYKEKDKEMDNVLD